MRFPAPILALAGALTMTGCSTFVSLNPFVSDQQAATDPALIGTWHGDDDTLFVIRQEGSVYTIRYLGDDSTAVKLEARLMIVGNAKFLDLVSKNDDAFQIPAHLLVRVWTGDKTLRWAFLDSDWLKEQAAKQLPVQALEKRTLATASSEAMHAFLLKNAGDDRAHGKIAVLEK